VEQSDRTILRDLAREVAEIAALPIQQERAGLLTDLNSLRAVRPVVLASVEGAWKELAPVADLRCKNELARHWERELRMALCRHEHIPSDNPIMGVIKVGWGISRGPSGVTTEFIGTDAFDRDEGSMTWDPPIKEFADLDKLHLPEIVIDRDRAQREEDLAREVLGEFMEIRRSSPLRWSYGLTERLIFLRGLEQVMIDMYENPRFLKELMAFIRDEAIAELELFEREGVLALNNTAADVVTNGLGATDELPGDDFAGHVRLKDLWVMAESQEFSGVGPDQFNEFALQFQLPILKRFGLCAYGCCEALDLKYDLLIEHLPNLRRVSVGPWADKALAAEKLAGNYIYAWKPNPAVICSPRPFYDQAEQEISHVLDVTRAHGCHLQIMLADTMTVRNEPQRFTRYIDLARELIDRSLSAS